MNAAASLKTRRGTVWSLAIAGALAIGFAEIAVVAQSRNPPPVTSGQSTTVAPAYIRQNAEDVSRRLHRALFNRDSDGSLNDTIVEVRAGRLRVRTEALVATPEFKTIRTNLQQNQLLDQIAQGLLSRGATPAEAKRYSAFFSRGLYTDIVMDYMASDEFRVSLVNAPSGGGGGGGGGVTTGAPVEPARAADCQEQVVEHMRDHTQGIVLLRFESAERDGGAIRGVAVDVIDNNRRLTYRCDGGPSYTYDDGRNTRSAPNEGDFPSERVRACQNNVRSRVQSQRPGMDVTFESAGVMSSGDKVRGLGFEKKPQGQNFHYRCDLNGTTVTNASVTWR
jgi:hypothetical protein